MDLLRRFLHLISSVEGITEIVRWGGLPILAAIVFAETGLLVGFFLPGDSLLVTAGFLCATTDALELGPVMAVLSLAAIVGDGVGYAIGRKAGDALYSRKDSRFFKQRHVQETRAFYEKYGPLTIVLARFIPIVRTFAPVVAGVAGMKYRRFLAYNVIGGVGWVVAVSLLGYFFGQIPFVQRHIEVAILLVIAVSLGPVVVGAIRSRRRAGTNA